MKNKVIVITGASSGIGKALAKEFSSRGCRLALAARRIDLLEELKNELSQTDILVIKTDVSIEDDCRQLIEKTLSHFGQIDVLINNAGISMRALFEDVDMNVLRKLMDVNFWGAVYCTKYALPHLLKAKGSVVGVVSVAGYIGLPARTGYTASKFAIRGFMNTLRSETLRKGLNVLVVAPGFTASEVRKSALTADGSPQGETPREENKMMTAEKCAKHIAKAVVKRKRRLILTFWEGKMSIFLAKFFPSLIDRLTYYLMAKEPDSPLN